VHPAVYPIDNLNQLPAAYYGVKPGAASTIRFHVKPYRVGADDSIQW